MKKDIILGILTGILANTLGAILWILIFSKKGLYDTVIQSIKEGFLVKIITLGAVVNLLVFFFFIRKKQDYRARGVLLATIVIAIAIMIYKFLS